MSAASFQFLVDALMRDWYVIAPDWRGFGKSAWCAGGYWFADYIADLEALLDHFTPGARVHLVGHSLGGNVVLHYARGPTAARRASGIARRVRHPCEEAETAPEKLFQWLDACVIAVAFRPMRTSRRSAIA